MNEIREFRDEYAFLSNFFLAPITLSGGSFPEPIRFPTNEHAFQAAKTNDHGERKRIAALRTPGAAKRAGRAIALREDWDEIRIRVMRTCVRAKFDQHPELAKLLLATGNATLTEGNNWRDRFWGVDLKTGEGQNWLGRILMEERARLALCTPA